MGYTHYFEFDPADDGFNEAFSALLRDAAAIRDAGTERGIRTGRVRCLQRPGGELRWQLERRPPIDEEGIHLNGWDPASPDSVAHETFWLVCDPLAHFTGDDSYSKLVRDRYGNDGHFWDFCKTARKPYDLVVATILLRADILIPKFHVSSDGSWTEREWQQARALYAELFGSAAKRPAKMRS